MPQRLEDYALIGDTHTAALVGRNGSIDWLCLPRFADGACFAALLGGPEHGRWLLAPAGETREVTRRYRQDTLVLETEFTTDDGTVRVIDCMPIRDCEPPSVLRRVEGVRGRVPMVSKIVLRFDYGHIVPWVRAEGARLRALAGPDAVWIDGDLPHAATSPLPDGSRDQMLAEFSVPAGEHVEFRLAWTLSRHAPPEHLDAGQAIDSTAEWWRNWAGRCRYQGDYPEAFRRSLITLKALIYAPSGGIVAAPTTSLPEKLGGVRNWDYRFCWIRDATFALLALLHAGYTEEATEWREWLLRAVAGTPRQMQIVYGIEGERRLTELELDWLPGYAGSRPVRLGNAASDQLQLDVYGEVMDALFQARGFGIAPVESAWQAQLALLDFLESAWRQPDNGIWEVRGPGRHFTHSKVMAWTALDRAIRTVENSDLPGPVDRWRNVRREIFDEVCTRAFDPELGAFTQYYGSGTLDGALLLIAPVGFLPATDPRVVGTVAAIERELAQDGFVLRYQNPQQVDGLPPGEGAFLPCTFWLADNHVLAGNPGRGREIFERLLGLTGDCGLLSEEYDPRRRLLVGNYPQALSHLALVNTALDLASAAGPTQSRAARTDTPSVESDLADHG